MSWLVSISTVVAAVVAVVKGIWGTDKMETNKIVEVDGEPIGPKLAERLRNLASVLAVCFLLSGCNVTMGPKEETNFVFVKHSGIAARAAENKPVLLVVEKDGKVFKGTVDIGGFYVISPDLKDPTAGTPLTDDEAKKEKARLDTLVK